MMAPSKESRRKVAVPMHTHLPRKMAGAQDYHVIFIFSNYINVYKMSLTVRKAGL